jgi:uncharacterized phage protein (predicted DNA packaging)
MLTDVKLALRVTTNVFDAEIQDMIDAARLDLVQSGISSEKAEDETEGVDPLIKRAITIYCKANFGYDNPDADRFNRSYVMLKQHMALASDYNGDPYATL